VPFPAPPRSVKAIVSSAETALSKETSDHEALGKAVGVGKADVVAVDGDVPAAGCPGPVHDDRRVGHAPSVIRAPTVRMPGRYLGRWPGAGSVRDARSVTGKVASHPPRTPQP
jgi:hypothetical protein